MNNQVRPLNNTATRILDAMVALQQVVGNAEILMANEIAVVLGDDAPDDAVKVQVIGEELVISFASNVGLGHLEETAQQLGFSVSTIEGLVKFIRPANLGLVGEALLRARRESLDNAQAAVDQAATVVREALEPSTEAPVRSEFEEAIERGQANMRARAEANQEAGETAGLSTGAKVAIGMGSAALVAGAGYLVAKRLGWKLPFGLGAAQGVVELAAA